MSQSVLTPLIASLVQSAQISGTALKPVAPTFVPDSYARYLSSLELAEDEIRSIPDSISGTWAQHFNFDFNQSLAKTEGSLITYFLDYADPTFMKIQENVKGTIARKYQDNTDEVDRVALSQIGSTLQWAWKYVGEYISHNLVEGTFLGLNDQGLYQTAADFSYLRMMNHTARADALRALSFNDETLFFVKSKHVKITELSLDQSEKLKLWRYRWMTAEKMAMLDYMLTKHRDLYTRIYFSQEEMPQDYRYKITCRASILDELSAELKAAYFNHMLEVKPKSLFTRYAEHYLNWFAAKVTSLKKPARIARPFDVVYMDVLENLRTTYDDLFPLKKTKADIDPVMESYLSALAQDNFIEAKWISLSVDTTETGQFDWLKEAESLENYKRQVDHLLLIQNHLDDIVTSLYRINNSLYNEYTNPLADKTSLSMFGLYERTNRHIREIWGLRYQIDDLRTFLRRSYIKKVKTTINETDKSYLDRLKQTLTNKALRMLLEGPIFDQTEPYETIIDKIRDFMGTYKDILGGRDLSPLASVALSRIQNIDLSTLSNQNLYDYSHPATGGVVKIVDEINGMDLLKAQLVLFFTLRTTPLIDSTLKSLADNALSPASPILARFKNEIKTLQNLFVQGHLKPADLGKRIEVLKNLIPEIKKECTTIDIDLEQCLTRIHSLMKTTVDLIDDAVPIRTEDDENFFKVFYTYEEFHQLVTKSKLHENQIGILLYNLERLSNSKYMINWEFWSIQYMALRKFHYVKKEIEKLRIILESLANTLPDAATGRVFKEYALRLATFSSTNLPNSYLKFIVSEWNRRNDLTAKRAVKSLAHKTVRLFSEGKIVDEKPEFPSIYPAIVNDIQEMARKINAAVRAAKLSDKQGLYNESTTIIADIQTSYLTKNDAAPSPRNKRPRHRSNIGKISGEYVLEAGE